MAQSNDRDTVTQGGSVTPERFARVREVFEAALERPAADRRGFVDGACGGDEGLRREVEAMLAAEARPDALLDSRPSSSAPEEGRFPAGTVLAGRYRILGLLGHGGMGEVYKAFDLILNQTVALKFLAPAHISEAALVRFRNEVRIARQVSHPNVCRVYDLGMVEGLHFLSMEYIDGEDLASLLRRIGRLPQDKAIEFTRKICAGLGAAHERGVLHRDLKPANIMIDGRGQPRITDFGLAGLAAEIPLSDLRSGTPAYMSPEQKAGKEVTTRSDIYSLGLVLHEMFTGKPRSSERGSTPSELVKDLDPAIERLILRCLEEEPKRRPSSALSVAMALPGADPIAAALAAGETPSPEMVAASTEKEGFSPRTAVLCFAGVVLSIVFGYWISQKMTLFALAPVPLPREALADRAQQFLKGIGYSEEPGSTAYGYYCCDAAAIANLDRYDRSRRSEILASHQPPIRFFRYHQHRTEQPPYDDSIMVQVPNAGTISVRLDPKGRLMQLEVRPWPSPPVGASVEWGTLFSAAGLDPARFTPAEPQSIPSMSSDARLAWIGTYAENRTEQVRVEAASWQGRPVFFDVLGTPNRQPFSQSLGVNIGYILLYVSVIPAAFTARRNLRAGRSDRQGAAVISSALLMMGLGWWALQPAHIPEETDSAIALLAFSVVGGASVFWILYIAIEPYLRRNWPDSLISWTRLSSGRLRNPLVASHILAGVLIGLVTVFVIRYGLAGLAGAPPLGGSGGDDLRIANALGAGLYLSGIAQSFVLMVVLLRLALRKLWIADAATVAVYSLGQLEYFGDDAWQIGLGIAVGVGVGLVSLWLLRRFGFLTVLVAFLAQAVPSRFPLTFSGWLAGQSIAAHMIPILVAAWALWVIFSAQRRPATESAA